MSLEKDIKNLVESMDLSLYEITTLNENDETIFRVSLTKSGGVSMDECVEVTKLISPLLDVTPPLKGEYRLEVSSPGIERKLKTLDHFKNSINEKVSIVNIDKSKVRGKLLAVNGDTLSIQNEDEKIEVSFKDISKAKTYFEW
ncbi:MAG: ribosome maturation factor RimP [Campylobacterota bacterium]|nr:ribosome maturation factor RimP [Campylobacterota bacterium]